MSSPRGISQTLGIGRGGFRKAILNIFLLEHAQKNSFKLVKLELGNKCVYCGISGEKARLQADHLMPQKQGGIFSLGNIVPSCPTCNSNRREIDWKSFIRTDDMINKNRNEKEIEGQIIIIDAYIQKHCSKGASNSKIELSEFQKELMLNIDDIMNLICEAVRIKIDNPQTKDVKFKNANDVFDLIVDLLQKNKL